LIGKTKPVRYVVSIYRGRDVILTADVTNESAASQVVEIVYPDVETLPETREVLMGLFNSIGYLIWKETGVLPAPLDMNYQDDVDDIPF